MSLRGVSEKADDRQKGRIVSKKMREDRES
jgi:hypothetical protein